MKKKEEAARRKEEKEKEKKSELESGTKSKYGKASAIKRYVPSKNLTVEEQKQEALQVALKDAQSRGLPEGWTCFYGVSICDNLISIILNTFLIFYLFFRLVTGKDGDRRLLLEEFLTQFPRLYNL